MAQFITLVAIMTSKMLSEFTRMISAAALEVHGACNCTYSSDIIRIYVNFHKRSSLLDIDSSTANKVNRTKSYGDISEGKQGR